METDHKHICMII